MATRHAGLDAPIRWIEEQLKPSTCPTTELLHGLLESQSGRTLSPHYVRFDASNRGHFTDRGSNLDFFFAVGGAGRVLDFGPGDGWPALVIAPWLEEVVGVEGAQRRVEECERNAERMGVSNARFVYVPPGEPLPFPDDSFDGATADASVEQTPDPKATLAELHRVLRPGGRLRLSWESLDGYAGRAERTAWLFGRPEGPAHLMIFQRFVREERVRHFRLTFRLTCGQVAERLDTRTGSLRARNVGYDVDYELLKPERLETLVPHLLEARTSETQHPSVRTLRGWLSEVGFSSIRQTYSGGLFARFLFDRIPEAQRPTSLEEVDAYLRPIIAGIVELDAPAEDVRRSLLTAEK